MTHYIDKSALVAEIKRRLWLLVPKMTFYQQRVELEKLLSFIGTLEVKEVDLEKELIKWHKQHFKKDGTFIGMSGFYLTNSSQMDIAKYFFELGLKAQEGE